MNMQWVVFKLSDEFYGVEIFEVESIIKKQAIARVPHMPPFVEGVMNLRGKVIPVVDLRKRFGVTIPAPAHNGKTVNDNPEPYVMVVSLEGSSVGMIVDVVTEVLSVNEKQVEPLSPVVIPALSSFFKGVAKVENRLIILVDLFAVLSLEEQEALRT